MSTKMTEHHIKSPPAATATAATTKKGRFSRFYRGGGYTTYRVRSRREGLCMCLFTVLLIAAIIALILWLLYRTNDPTFRVVSATVNQLSATNSPPLVTAAMQFTVVMRNPNRRTDLVYDDLVTFVTYHNQPITAPLVLPPLRHETKTTLAMSPMIGGAAPAAVPVEGDVVNALMNDRENYGVVGITLVVTGNMRYRGGPVGRRRHRVYVTCDLFVSMRGGSGGQLPILGNPPCDVNVY